MQMYVYRSLVNLILFNKDEDNIFYAKELEKVVKGGRFVFSIKLHRLWRSKSLVHCAFPFV